MIAARPNAIPQYGNTYGADFPRAEAMKFKLPHDRYQHQVKRAKVKNTPANPMAMLGQRNQMDQSLPSMKTPFELRHTLSRLGGIAGYYGTTTQSAKPIRAQKGVGAYGFASNMSPRNPLQNRNF
jgi:hypothetical protein